MTKAKAILTFSELSAERDKLIQSLKQSNGNYQWQELSKKYLADYMGEVCRYLINEYDLDEKWYGKSKNKILKDNEQ